MKAKRIHSSRAGDTRHHGHRRFRPSLGGQVVIGLLLGIATGVFFGESAGGLRVVGDAFILLMQVAVLPYIVVSLITALGRLTLTEARRLGLAAGTVVLVLWAIGAAVLLLAPLAFPDWPSASFFSRSLVDEPKPIDFLRLYIPANPFASLANGVVPAVVVFSVLIGIALIGVRSKERLLEPLGVIAEALMAVARFVSRLAPVGVFALAASAAGTLGLEQLDRLQVYVTTHLTLAILLSFWVLPRLVTLVTPLRYGELMHALRGALITAFAAGSVLIVLPQLSADCKRLLSGDGEAGDAVASVDVLVPAAYNIPSLGNMLSLTFILFAGWSTGSSIPAAEYPLVIGAGLASLFGGPVLAIPFLLDLLKLPHDLFQVFMTIDVLGSRISTLVAVMTITTTALLGASSLVGRLRLRTLPLLRFAGVTIALMAGALIGIHAFFSHVVVAPYTQAQSLKGLHPLGDLQPAVVERNSPASGRRPTTGPADLARMRERGELRACFIDNDFPAAFVNTDGQLVGFDIELVQRLSRSLNLAAIFVPVRGEAEAAGLLRAGSCDLMASTMAISARRMETFTMTIPVYTSSVGLLVPDHRRQAFRSWEEIRHRGATVRIAVPATPEALELAGSLLPRAKLVPMRSLSDLRRLLESPAPEVDAIADLSEKGAAWTLLHPHLHLVVPEPVVFTEQGFGLAHGNGALAQTLDAWIISEKARGTVNALYRHWMLGEAVKTSQPPRWSVIRNVLHWVN